MIGGIVKANINTDWSNAGAGITLRYGIIWMDDSDGRLFGINYQTDIGKKKRNELIESDRKRLHSSLRDYLEPILEWKTQKYRIRIDILKNYKYRYSVWTLPLSVKEKPDLVLDNGNVEGKGSMGNSYFNFRNGSFIYGCYVPANEWEKGYLEVFRNEELIRSEKVVEVIDPGSLKE